MKTAGEVYGTKKIRLVKCKTDMCVDKLHCIVRLHIGVDIQNSLLSRHRSENDENYVNSYIFWCKTRFQPSQPSKL